MKNSLLLICSLLLTMANAEGNRCYEYSASSYTLVHKESVTQKLDTHNYRLLMVNPEKENRLHTRYFFLFKKDNASHIEFTSFTCPSKVSKPDRLYCYGECDSGIVSIEKDKAVNFKTKSITLGEPMSMWEIQPVDEADMAMPQEVSCPESIESMQLTYVQNSAYIDEMVESLDKPIMYVCYTSKNIIKSSGKATYHGCRFTRSKCDDYYSGWKHFGKYGSEKKTLQAFERCKNSTPK